MNSCICCCCCCYPNGIKTPLANSYQVIVIKGNQVFSNGPKRLPKSPPDCPILCNCAFHNLILGEELFEQAIQSFQTCVLVNNNL